MKDKVSPEILHEVLDYNKDTGVLTWKRRPRKFFKTDGEHKRWNGRYAGKPAFTPNSDGYLDGYIFRIMHRAHRVAWAMTYGSYPEGQIDHINGKRKDNRIANLRVVTNDQNAKNQRLRSTNKTGVNGVFPHKNRWRSYIYSGGKQIHLGVFDTIEDAKAAREMANKEYGFHDNHGLSS